LVGYSGRGNVGDDLMRDALLDVLPPLLPLGATIQSRRLPPLSRRGLVEALRLVPALVRADLVLLAGGSHFHDRFGWRSVRILALLLGLLALARLGGARVGFAGVGIGPLGGRASRALVRRLLRLADAALVRDPRSARIAHRLAPECAVLEGLDVALLLPPPVAGASSSGAVTTLGISVIPYFREFEGDDRNDARAIETLADAAGTLASEGPLRVRLLPLFDPPREPSRSDRVLAERLATLLFERGVEVRICASSVEQVRVNIAECDAVLATRYHAALMSYVARKPQVVLAYDLKCTALADQIGLPRTALLSPHDLLEPGVIERRLRHLLATPTAFEASLALDEARKRAVASLHAFMDLVVREASTGLHS